MASFDRPYPLTPMRSSCPSHQALAAAKSDVNSRGMRSAILIIQPIPAADEMNPILAPSVIRGMTASVRCRCPTKLTSITRWLGAVVGRPAQLNNESIGPPISATMVSIAAGSDRSHR